MSVDPGRQARFERDVEKAVVIDTADGLEYFALLQLLGRLKIEIETGLKFRQSTLSVINAHFGTNHRNKKVAYNFVLERKGEAEKAKYGMAMPHTDAYKPYDV